MSMVEGELFLKALGDVFRLEILEYIKTKPHTSAEIQKALNKSQSTISQHLKVLVEENIITFKRDGAVKIYEIKDSLILTILSTINSFLIRRNQQKETEQENDAIADTLRV